MNRIILSGITYILRTAASKRQVRGNTCSLLRGEQFTLQEKKEIGQQVLGSAVAGAIGVGVVSKVSQAAKIYKLGKTGTALAKTLASPVGDAAGSVANQVIANDDHNVAAEQIKDDIIAGVIGNVAGGVASSYIKNSSGYKSALKKFRSCGTNGREFAKSITCTSSTRSREYCRKLWSCTVSSMVIWCLSRSGGYS